VDIQFYGANCITITTKEGRLVIDDNLADVGLKSIAKAGDVLVYTGTHGAGIDNAKLVVDQPGEYEVSNFSITGLPAQAHMDEPGTHKATMYTVTVGDVKVFVTGHIYPNLSEIQLERIGMADIMIVPIGGNGYTLDSIGALQLIKKVEPKAVIPTNYADAAIQYVVPQQNLQDGLVGLAMEPVEAIAKFKVKSADLADITQLIVLERS
jgi:L-ascorbate metabolism protein UlaG (beta-lactamase superfamily)